MVAFKVAGVPVSLRRRLTGRKECALQIFKKKFEVILNSCRRSETQREKRAIPGAEPGLKGRCPRCLPPSLDLLPKVSDGLVHLLRFPLKQLGIGRFLRASLVLSPDYDVSVPG